MVKILVTNDDGVQSEGIHALAAALRPLGEVTIVAPVGESSAIGHALTLARPLRLERVAALASWVGLGSAAGAGAGAGPGSSAGAVARLTLAAPADHIYTVDGTPTDCVNIGITIVLRTKPDLIVSGINKGYNLGDDVTYSGTVAGALEGALLGIPSLAVSLERTRGELDFSRAAAAAATVAASVLRQGMPPRTLLNINVPRRVTGGFRVTVQARRNHETRVTESVDPRGRPYYWIEEGESEWLVDERSDYHAVKAGHISITPLQPDLTRFDALGYVEGLPLDAPVAVD